MNYLHPISKEFKPTMTNQVEFHPLGQYFSFMQFKEHLVLSMTKDFFFKKKNILKLLS